MSELDKQLNRLTREMLGIGPDEDLLEGVDRVIAERHAEAVARFDKIKPGTIIKIRYNGPSKNDQ